MRSFPSYLRQTEGMPKMEQPVHVRIREVTKEFFILFPFLVCKTAETNSKTQVFNIWTATGQGQIILYIMVIERAVLDVIRTMRPAHVKEQQKEDGSKEICADCFPPARVIASDSLPPTVLWCIRSKKLPFFPHFLAGLLDLNKKVASFCASLRGFLRREVKKLQRAWCTGIETLRDRLQRNYCRAEAVKFPPSNLSPRSHPQLCGCLVNPRAGLQRLVTAWKLCSRGFHGSNVSCAKSPQLPSQRSAKLAGSYVSIFIRCSLQGFRIVNSCFRPFLPTLSFISTALPCCSGCLS